MTFDVPIVETERLLLRKPDGRDIDAAIEFFRSDRAIAVGGPFSKGRAWRAYAGIVGHWELQGYGPFAIVLKKTGKTIGLVGPCFSGDYDVPDLGWDIWDAALEGKGLAFEAAIAAKKFVFEVLGWDSLVSYVDEDNPRSTALAKRLGGIADETPDKTFGDICWVYRYSVPATVEADGGIEAYA